MQYKYTSRELSLDTEAIKSTSGALERVDDIESGHSLPLGMLGVCDRVADDLKWLLGRVQITKAWHDSRFPRKS
jgi:hypothetical protein